MEETVERVMPDADWVMDKDNHLHIRKPKGRRYKVGVFTSDLHGKHHYKVTSPVVYADMVNKASYDAVFMRYPYLYGAGYDRKVFYNRLQMSKYFLPWSVDTERFKPLEKTYDVGFIGAIGDCYPIRQQVWDNLYYVARGYKVYRNMAPKGKTFERQWSKLKDTHLVGDDYAKRLGETRIMIFDCSYYLYPIQKLTQTTSAGCLMMCNQPSMGKKLGFIPWKTYVEIDEHTWEDTLLYFLENPKEGGLVAKQGMEMTRERHSHEVRAAQFISLLEKELD